MRPKDDHKIEAIRQATCRLVAEHGLSRVTLADIAKAAGIATSTLYVYYASKEALLDAVYERAKTATFQRMLANDDSDAPFKRRIRGIWLNMLNNRLENHAEQVLLEQYYHSAYMSDANRQLGERFARVIQTLLLEGLASEQLKPVPLAQIQAFTLGSVKELAALIRRGALPDDETTRQDGFTLYWDAIKA